MDGLVAFTVVFIIFAIGDFVSSKTKAIVSTLVFSSLVYLVGFWLGLPTTIFSDSTMLQIGGVIVAILLVNMGTTISFKTLITQWKTIVVGLAAITGIGIFAMTIGSMIIGRQMAVAGAPILAGGTVALLIMGEAANGLGLTEVAVFITFVCVVQNFFGYPISSACLKSEGRRIIGRLHSGELKLEEAVEASSARPKHQLIPPVPEKYQTATLLIAKLAIVALISQWLANLTNGTVNKLAICLVLGVVFKEIGFLGEDDLKKANSFGITMSCITVLIFGSLSKCTPDMLVKMILPLIAFMAVGILGIFVFSVIFGKLVGFSWQIAFAIGSTALFGFPGTYIVTEEVVNALASSDEEKAILMQEMMPKMIVGGMITMSIGSVLMSGVMAKML